MRFPFEPLRRTLVPAVYLLLAAFAASVPVWAYSIAWGDRPSELIGLALVGLMIAILVRPDDRRIDLAPQNEDRSGKVEE